MTQLGKYELHEQLGKGGFGTVYRATDDIGRTVAIKVLKPAYADDPDITGRFKREALTAGSLFHPHIATILDFGESDGRPYLIMRYVDGKPLGMLLKEKSKLPWKESLEILRQIGEALDFAHSKGFVHRDIKPANIIVSPTEGAVLTDFGLVKAVATSGLSTTGVMLGTPAYIAPEVWSGKEATAATDVYSLACVFYEMITGKVLFDAESTPEVMKKHFDPISLPKSWPEGVPANLGPVLENALEEKITQRYKNVSSFLAALKNLENPPDRNSAEVQKIGTDKNIEKVQVITTPHENMAAQVEESNPTLPQILRPNVVPPPPSMSSVAYPVMGVSGTSPASKLAKWSLGLSISGYAAATFLSIVPFFGIIGVFGEILALVFGIIDVGKIKKLDQKKQNSKSSVAGIILSSIFIFIYLVFLIIYLATTGNKSK